MFQIFFFGYLPSISTHYTRNPGRISLKYMHRSESEMLTIEEEMNNTNHAKDISLHGGKFQFLISFLVSLL